MWNHRSWCFLWHHSYVTGNIGRAQNNINIVTTQTKSPAFIVAPATPMSGGRCCSICNNKHKVQLLGRKITVYLMNLNLSSRFAIQNKQGIKAYFHHVKIWGNDVRSWKQLLYYQPYGKDDLRVRIIYYKHAFNIGSELFRFRQWF